MKRFVVFAALLCCSTYLLPAAEGPEDYRLELSARLWRMNSNGTFHSSGDAVNLITDFGVHQREKIFDGSLTWRFKRKMRLVVEGTPISIHGLNTINRNITYFGEQYSVSETLQSSGNINYIYGGLHRDFYHGRFGRVGSSAGLAYLGLQGTTYAEQSGVNKKGSTPFGLPMIGVDFRIYPIPGHRLLAVEGAVRGLPAGSYGHWFEASGGVGSFIGPIGVQLGYRQILMNFHQTGPNPDGMNLRFYGPVAAVFWNW